MDLVYKIVLCLWVLYLTLTIFVRSYASRYKVRILQLRIQNRLLDDKFLCVYGYSTIGIIVLTAFAAMYFIFSL